MGNSPDFQKAKMLARELRLMQSSDRLALYPEELEFDRDITIDTFEHYSSVTGCPIAAITLGGTLQDGYTIVIDKGNGLFSYIILFHERNRGTCRTTWTILHEVGHIYMGHMNDGQTEEIEAHWFASEFLIPIPIISELLKRLNTVTIDMICSIFPVSVNAGLKKISSMKRMYKWSTYLYEDFSLKYSDSIDEYVNQRNMQNMS